MKNVCGFMIWLAMAGGLQAGDDHPKATPVWTLKTKKNITNVAEVLGGSALFARDGDYAMVVNVSDGSIRWEKKLDGFNDKGVNGVWNDNEFVYSTKKEIVGINLVDGSEKYRRPAKKDVDVSESVGTLRTKTGVLVLYKKSTVFYDLDGNDLWVRNDQNMTVDDYKVFENGNIMAFYAKSVHMIDCKSGTSLWSRSDQGFRPDDYHQLTSGNFLAFYSKDVQLIDFTSGRTLYSAGDESHKDLAYVWARGGGDHAPVALLLKKKSVLINGITGQELWSTPVAGNKDRGNPKKGLACATFMGKAAVYFLDRQVTCVNSATGQENWKETVKDNDEIEEAEAFEITNTEDGSSMGGLIVINGAALRFNAEGVKQWRTADQTFRGQVCKLIPLEGNDYIIVSGKRAFLMTSGDLGVHMTRINIADGSIRWQNQSRSAWTSVVENSAKSTIDGFAHGPFVFKDHNLIVLTTNMGLNLFNLSDGKLLHEGKWIQNEIGTMKNHKFTFDETNMVFQWSIVPPAPSGGLVQMYKSAFSGMRNTTFTNLNPDPLIRDEILYVAAKDRVYAFEIKTGKKAWEAKTNGPVAKFPFTRGMILENGVLYCRTGAYLDENILFNSGNPKPAVYIDKGDFGFIAIDSKSGKVLWNVQDFDKADPLYIVDMITDQQLAKTSENSDCRLKKLKLGFVNLMIDRPTYRFFGGGEGVAGTQAESKNPCLKVWKIQDECTAMWPIRSLSAGTSTPIVFFDNAKLCAVSTNSNLYLVDEANMTVKWMAKREGKGEVLMSEKNGLLLDIDGKNMFAYKL
jgi:outer membrane protein assembly factor BamB